MAKKKKHVTPKPAQVQSAQSAPAQASQPVKAQPVKAQPALGSRWTKQDTIFVVIYFLLLFVAMTVQTSKMSVFLAILAIVVSIGKMPLKNFRAHLSIPTVGLLAFALLNGISVLYSNFGGTAVAEYYKFTASFSLAIILLARFEKKHTRALLWGLGTVCAAISLLCIDLNSWYTIFPSFRVLAEALGTNYENVVNVGMGQRHGLYGDANLTGALLGMSSVVGIYLVSTSEKLRDKLLASLVLGFSMMGFFLSVSRGSYLCFGLAALVYLAVAGRGSRIRLFFLMLATAVSLLISGGLAMMTMKLGSVWPVLLTPVCGLLIFVLDRFVTGRIAAKLASHAKAFAITCGALVLAVVIAVVAALNITVPYRFTQDGSFYRSHVMDPGNYTISADITADDAEIRLVIGSHTHEESLMGRQTILYDGPVSGASFTVPDDSTRVFFTFYGSAGESVNEVRLSDGQKLPLSYRFIPESLAYRLHEGLLTSSAFLLRAQYMKDGLVLFTKSPIIGHGLGASENLLTSVQPFYYESLFIHNHIIQVMTETGILGLISFLALIGGSFWLIIRRLRKESDPLASMLIAALVMMNVHSLMEINFSIRMYQCVSFILLLIPVLQYGQPLSKKVVKLGGWIMSAFVWIYLAVFGWLLISHRAVQQEAAVFSSQDAGTFMNTMRGFTNRDPMDPTQYQLNFVGNAVLMEDDYYHDTMQQYVKELEDDFNYTTQTGLSRYYYLPLGMYDKVFESSFTAIAQEAANKVVWNAQLEYYRTVVLPTAGAEHMDEFLAGIDAFESYLAQFSVGRLEEIELTEASLDFLDKVHQVKENNMSAADAFALLSGMVF